MLFRKFANDFAEKYRTPSIQLDEGARRLLMTYGWPGNVRELKNITEQISVLSKEKQINADQLSRFLPTAENSSRLPALAAGGGMPAPSHQAGHSTYSDTTEREILYKLFFDLKKDMNDLKKFLFEMANHQGFPTTTLSKPNRTEFEQHAPEPGFNTPAITNYTAKENSGSKPFFIHQPNDPVAEHEEVEESLSLVDREREFIIKALQKHRGKRKDAAHELGISERTLYRKIKEYNIEE